ncbi:pirin family protein [Sungkyunkwania multivorans]|uniref:Pirin family protein n=1 Tax=Sungkyunkwania multivorans TaxID=1173618 RepID=A0ABW3CXY4_9FLAO
MKKVLHKAATRGHANHGWLNSYHTFSFANYHDPKRMNFGVLRVLNDDTVSAGMGFGKHPHSNMEIISIPLYGDLEHEDSMGNKTVIKEGDVQVMTAGTGVFHSEYNKNTDKEVKFLQIWIMPKKRNVEPRYDQISLQPEEYSNKLLQLISPNGENESMHINQDAWFHIGALERSKELQYDLKGKNTGVYAFVIEGAVSINDELLEPRDGLGIWEVEQLHIKANTDTKLLLMEVPMSIQ